jgi:hypothetical protein
MNKPLRLALMTLFLSGLIAAIPMVAFAGGVSVVPPDQKFAGKTYGQWSAAWWQWAALPPASQSPLTDTTGARCAVDQDDSRKVWFLAGTTGGSATRRCTVPDNLGVLFPIINNECSSVEGNGNNYQMLKGCASPPMDQVSVAQAQIDGKAIQSGPVATRFRAVSPPPPFPITFGPHNAFNVPHGSGISVADGYWVLLAPLPRGEHTISFHGVLGSFEVSVTYYLTVRPPD